MVWSTKTSALQTIVPKQKFPGRTPLFSTANSCFPPNKKSCMKPRTLLHRLLTSTHKFIEVPPPAAWTRSGHFTVILPGSSASCERGNLKLNCIHGTRTSFTWLITIFTFEANNSGFKSRKSCWLACSEQNAYWTYKKTLLWQHVVV